MQQHSPSPSQARHGLWCKWPHWEFVQCELWTNTEVKAGPVWTVRKTVYLNTEVKTGLSSVNCKEHCLSKHRSEGRSACLSSMNCKEDWTQRWRQVCQSVQHEQWIRLSKHRSKGRSASLSSVNCKLDCLSKRRGEGRSASLSSVKCKKDCLNTEVKAGLVNKTV